MKTTPFLTGFLLQTLIMFGQPYQSIFSTDTTRWNIYECSPDAGGTIAYYSFSDTIINQKVYHKMYRENIYSADQQLGNYLDLCGFVHEDTVLGKYWFLKFDNEDYKEALFMDLNLSKGDSIAIIRDFRDMWTDSVVVDSVYYLEGKKIISIDQSHFDCNNEFKVKFIESIGSTNGFYMGEWLEQPEPYTLMCKFDNGVKSYLNGYEWDNNCYRHGGASIEDLEFGKSIKLYPNPSTGKLNIEIYDFKTKFFYTIYNSMGQTVSKGQMNSNVYELELNNSGIFYITISDEKLKTTKKIIIKGY